MVEPIAGVPQLRLKHSVVNRKLAQIEPTLNVSPLPVTTTHLTESSPRRCSSASIISSRRATERAFFFSSRSKVIVATPSSQGDTRMLAIAESSQARAAVSRADPLGHSWPYCPVRWALAHPAAHQGSRCSSAHRTPHNGLHSLDGCGNRWGGALRPGQCRAARYAASGWNAAYGVAVRTGDTPRRWSGDATQRRASLRLGRPDRATHHGAHDRRRPFPANHGPCPSSECPMVIGSCSLLRTTATSRIWPGTTTSKPIRRAAPPFAVGVTRWRPMRPRARNASACGCWTCRCTRHATTTHSEPATAASR